MKTLNLLVVISCCMTLSIFSPYVKGEARFDWMPAQINEQGLNSQDLGGEQIIPEITITKTPKPTADISKYTNVYTLELEKFNISNDGTNADETSKGLNAALQHAKTTGANRIVFPTGTYLISETEPIVFDHKNTIVDLNGSTLQIRTNGAPEYNIVQIIDGTENFRLTNGTLRGDRDTHDMTTIKSSHEHCRLLYFFAGKNLEVDHVTFTKSASTGVGSGAVGNRNRQELLDRIMHSVYVKDLEQGAFSKKGVKIDSTEKTRTIKPYDITKCGGEFEFGYVTGYQGYPFIKGRVYQAYFYDKNMKFLEMKKCLQFRKVTIPKGAVLMHLEINQPEVTDEPAHYGAAKGSFIARITNYTPPVDVHFHDNITIDNRNLGLGYCGGQRWLIEDCVFEKNGPDIVGWGIDFEDGWELMQDVVLRNNVFKGNLRGDVVICAGTELLFEGNTFSGNLSLAGRPHNYIFRNNKFTGGQVTYTTRTGVAKIHDNTYENCNLSIVFDTKAVADGLYRKPGETVATPPLILENETMTNVSKITGTYFNFKNAKLKNSHFIAGDKTGLINLENCTFDEVSLEYLDKGPDVHFKIKDCKGELKEKGPGLTRKKLVAQSTIWLIGDSTVASYPKERNPLAGWGQLLHEYCRNDVTINNHAVSGTTSHSFRSRKFWDKVIPNVQKGDYMFIQFGHNDHYKERGQHLVSTEDFKQNLIEYVKEAREKGALPILVTPMCRRIYSKGKITRGFGDYPDMVVQAAKETRTPLIDLHEITYKEFNKLDDDQIKAIFLFLPPNKYPAFPEGKRDGVHFQTNGARKLAGWVVRDAKKQQLEIAELFEEAAEDASEAQLEELSRQATEDSLISIRPGQPEKSPFWNTHARRFMYAPSFNFKSVKGVAKYRFTATSSVNNKEYAFLADSPWASLAPIWTEIPVGEVTLKVEAIDPSGEIIGASELAEPQCLYQEADQSGHPKLRKFFRAAPFRGGYHDVSVSYHENAVRALKYLYNEKHIQKWAADGQPDPNYIFYCYPSKITRAVIDSMLMYSKVAPVDAATAIQIAENAADKLIKQSQPTGAPLEYLPPTYDGMVKPQARLYAGQLMMTYPAGVANTYLDLYEVTKKDKYLQAAKRIAATYAKLQLPSGTWYLKINIETGEPITNNLCLPMAMIGLFDRLANNYGMAKYKENSQRAFDWIMTGPVSTFNWEGQFEDVAPTRPYRNLERGQACSVAVYLLDNFADNDMYVSTAVELLRFAEDQFVIWEKEKYAPLEKKEWVMPCVLEQYGYYVPIDASAASLIAAYQKAHEVTGKKLYLAKARALADSMVVAQDAKTGRYPTYWWEGGFEEEYWLNCAVRDIKVMLEFAQMLDK